METAQSSYEKGVEELKNIITKHNKISGPGNEEKRYQLLTEPLFLVRLVTYCFNAINVPPNNIFELMGKKNDVKSFARLLNYMDASIYGPMCPDPTLEFFRHVDATVADVAIPECYEWLIPYAAIQLGRVDILDRAIKKSTKTRGDIDDYIFNHYDIIKPANIDILTYLCADPYFSAKAISHLGDIQREWKANGHSLAVMRESLLKFNPALLSVFHFDIFGSIIAYLSSDDYS